MADGTVRGTFELEGRDAISTLTTIRDRGMEADASLERLGRRMDTLGTKSLMMSQTVSATFSRTRFTVEQEADRMGMKIDELSGKLDKFGSMRSTPTVKLEGVDKVNAQISELEARLDALSRRRADPRVSIGGGFASSLAGGGDRGGAISRTGGGGGGFGALGGISPLMLAAPFAPGLLGGATSLLGSAGSATLGLGSVGIGGLGTLGIGGLLTGLVAKPAIQNLSGVTAAMDAQQQIILRYGPHSKQAQTGQAKINALIANQPLMAGAVRQGQQLVNVYSQYAKPAQSAFYQGVGNLAYTATRAVPQIAPLETQAVTATMGGANQLLRTLTDRTSIGQYSTLTHEFVRDMPLIERSLGNIARIFLNLSTAGTPFFHQSMMWLSNWTGGIAKSTADTGRVQGKMQGYVNSARDWARLTGAAYRTLRDIFRAGTPQGNSMVTSLTDTLNRWDQWINQNPQKVQNFFNQAKTTTEGVAKTITNLIHDVMQVFNYLSPIFSRGLQFLQLFSGLGAGGAGILGALAYGGYSGLRSASGGALPSAGGLAGAYVMGGAGPGLLRGNSRFAGGAAVSPISVAGRASNLEVATGRTAGGVFLMGGATSGPDAVLARRQAAAAARDAGALSGLRSRVATLVSESPAAARAADIASNAGRLAIGAASGIVRTVAPLLAINAGIDLLSAHGGLQSHVGAVISGLSAGTISPQLGTRLAPMAEGGAAGAALARFAPSLITRAAGSIIGPQLLDVLGPMLTRAVPVVGAVAGALVSPSSTGASFAHPETQRGLKSIAQAANSVRTPEQLHAVQTRATLFAKLGFEMSPQDAAKLRAELTSITSVAAKNAGASASNAWQQSFTTGLTTVGPKRDVALMMSGMTRQIRELGPQGSKAFATDTAQWVNQLVQQDPKLAKPMLGVMNTITGDINRMYEHAHGKFKDLQNMVFYFNGQIYTGVKSTWGAISDSLVNPISVAQEKQLGIWKQIQAQAVNALTTMGFSRSQAQSLVTATAQGGRSAAVSASLIGAVNQGATASTLPTSTTSAYGPYSKNTQIHATGGVLGGAGLLDTVPMPDGSYAAPGEAWIANRHTMNDLSRATLSKFGKTAWEMIRDETRTHSSPPKRGQHFFGGRMAVPSNTSSTAGGGGSSGYVYPFPNLSPGRTDQGYDLSGSGPLYALGPGRVLTSSLWPGWPGTGGVVYQLTGGPDAGRNVYYMEHVQATVRPGQMVSAGQQVGTLLSGYPFLESGWANSAGTGPLTPYNGAADGTPMPGGVNFRQFVNALLAGGKLPSGIGMAGAGIAAALKQVHLRSPVSGLGGVPGIAVNQSGRNYAAALQQKLNSRLGAMGGTGLGGSFSGTLSGSVENQVAQFMGAAGFNKIAIAGMLGNAMQESSMNPNAAGGGLFQQISNFGGGTGGSVMAQLSRMLPQIQSLKGAMNAAGSPGAAATIFEQGFERAGIPALSNRINYANAAYASGYARGGRMHWGGWNSRGANFLTNGPTMFGAGEGGRRERVSVTPANTPTHPGRSIAVNFHGPLYVRDEKDAEQIGRMVAGKIMDALDEASSGTTDHELASMGAGSAN